MRYQIELKERPLFKVVVFSKLNEAHKPCNFEKAEIDRTSLSRNKETSVNYTQYAEVYDVIVSDQFPNMVV